MIQKVLSRECVSLEHAHKNKKRKEGIGKKETVYKESLARAQDESTKISETITNAKSKVRHFDNCSLVDGLL